MEKAKETRSSGDRYFTWRLFWEALLIGRSVAHWFGAEASGWQQFWTITSPIIGGIVGALVGRSIDTEPTPTPQTENPIAVAAAHSFWFWGAIIGLGLTAYVVCLIFAHYRHVARWRAERDETQAQLDFNNKMADPKPSRYVVKARKVLRGAIKEYEKAKQRGMPIDDQVYETCAEFYHVVREVLEDGTMKTLRDQLISEGVAINADGLGTLDGIVAVPACAWEFNLTIAGWVERRLDYLKDHQIRDSFVALSKSID